ncbi:MAG: sulfite exporter TauE/SafE family protein [Verrucomicrobiota bacterium]
MNEVILQPLLAGLSTGLFCSTYCLPFIAPYLVAERRSARATAKVLLEFILGRLGGYVLFGAVVGYLGQRLDSRVFNLVSIGSLVLLSGLLLLYAADLVKPQRSLCLNRRWIGRKTPLLMGFLMGVNICPPFLLSVAYVFTLHSMVKGVAYFLVFFAATTLYFLPMFFLGFLGRMNEFRAVARVSALMVGVLFLAYGVYAIARGTLVMHSL